MRTRRVVWLRVICVSLIAVLLLGTLGFSVAASTFREEGYLGPDQVVDDDLIMGGERVVLEGTVTGDAICFGAEVIVTGEVQGSLMAMASNVTINGAVGGSVYTGASSVTLGADAEIGRNTYFGGFDLMVNRGARIAKDLIAGGYQVQMDGLVGRDLKAGLGALDLNGSVGGDVLVEIAPPGEATPMVYTPPSPYSPPPARNSGLRVGREAEIGGQLRYKSEQPQSEAILVEPNGGVNYERVIRADDEDLPVGARGVLFSIMRWVVKRLRDLVTLAILGGLAVWLMPKCLDACHDELKANPWPSLGKGVLSWVGGFVAAGIFFGALLMVGILLGVITLGGLATAWFGIGLSLLGLIFSVFLILVTYGSKLVVAYLVGRAIFGNKYEGHAYWPLLIGILLYVFLRGIPFVGWLFGLAVTCFGLGAMWPTCAELLGRLRKKHSGQPAEGATIEA